MPVLIGTPLSDNLVGTAGDDQIYGLGGFDMLTGGAGADYIDGGDGGDIIRGDDGADVLRGGGDTDLFVYDGPSQSNASAYDLIVDFETGIDRIGTIFVPFEVSIVREGGSSFVFMRYITGGEQVVFATLGRDVNARDFGDIDRQGGAITMLGSSGADVLIGGAGRNTIFGRGGNDTIEGGAGDDVLFGGSGANSLSGGEGRDLFVLDWTTAGRDVVSDFSRGNDQVVVSAGGSSIAVNYDPTGRSIVVSDNASITSSGAIQPADLSIPVGATVLVSDFSSGGRIIIGGSNIETIWGYLGADMIAGGGGADRFLYRAANESTADAMDVIVDFQSGVDRIVLEAFAVGTVANVAYNANGAFIFVDVGGNGTNDMVIGLAGVLSVAANDIAITFASAQYPENSLAQGLSPDLPIPGGEQTFHATGDWYLFA